MTPAILKSLRAMSIEDYDTILAEAEEIVALAQRGRSMVNAFNMGVEMSAALQAEHRIHSALERAIDNIMMKIVAVEQGKELASLATSLERTLEERT